MNIFACIFNVLFAAEGLTDDFQIVEVKKGTQLACRCKLGYGHGDLTSDLHFTIPFVDSTKGKLSVHIKTHSFMLSQGENIYKQGANNKKHEYKTKKQIEVASLASGVFKVDAETCIMSFCTTSAAAAGSHSTELFEFEFKDSKVFLVEDGSSKIDKNHLSGVKFVKISINEGKWFYQKPTTPIGNVQESCLSTHGKFLFVNAVEMLKAIEDSTESGKYRAMLSYEHICEITVTSDFALLFVKDVGKNVDATGGVVETAST